MIAIPSYKRAIICRDKTVAMLKRHSITKFSIFVIEEEADEYKKVMPECNIIIGVKGLVKQRQFIHDYYPLDTNLVYMDDDLDEIDLSFTNYTLSSFIEDAFKIAREKKSFIWGVYPCFNPYFRKNREEMSTCLNFIIGCFYGIIIHENVPILISNGNKDDVERSLRYFIKDGIVLRFNKIGIKTKFYSLGGLGTRNERMENVKQDALNLQTSFPDYGRIKVRKNGIYEFILRKIHN